MTYSDAVEATIREEEARLRRIWDHEEAVLIDSGTGEVILRRSGGLAQVGFNEMEVRLMRGHILTHNHPTGSPLALAGQKDIGNSFSPADIGILVSAQLGELRAVSRRCTFSVSPPDNHDHSQAAEAYRSHISTLSYRSVMEIVDKFSSQILDAQLRSIPKHDRESLDHALRVHFHVVVTELARSWALKYSVEGDGAWS